MRIWIDGYEANVPQRLGSSQVAFELLRHLEKIDHKNEYTILLPNNPMDDLPKERPGWKYRVLKPRQLWTRIALTAALYFSKEKPHVFLSPTHYIPRFSPVPRVCIIFDLSYLHFPQMFTKKDLWQLINWSRFSIEHADQILTISKSTKKDIIKHYEIPEEKITVAYPGYDSKTFRPPKDKAKVMQIINKYKIKQPYVIYIGTIQPRKNLVCLMKAIKEIGDINLVIVGKTTGLGRQAWMFEEILRAPKDLGIQERVVFTGFVPTEELPYLLSGAKEFVLPSLWEGFGIPVVEAMATGCPVVVSNVSSLPEVVGDAGILVNPKDPHDIARGIKEAIEKRDQLIKKGLEHAKQFSWQKTAKQTLEVLERAANPEA